MLLKAYKPQWIIFLLLAIFCLPYATPHANSIDLPDIGLSANNIMTPQEEQKIGESFMRHLRRSIKIVDDPEISEYINMLGYQLVANSDSPTEKYTFFIIEDSGINAFAAPGGYIGINSGLLLATQSESELAAVLAHEIAHITQRHLIRSLEKGGQMNLATVAAIIAAIALSSQDGQASQAVLMSTIAGQAQAQINFTRTHEKEADRLGMPLLARAGFDPRSMPLFFERLHQASRYYENSAPAFLQTHPVTLDRITDSRNRAVQYPEITINNSHMYATMRNKLYVVTHTEPKQITDYFQAALKEKPTSENRYGYALALRSNGQYAESRAELNKLIEKEPHRISYLIALAQTENAEKNTDKALKIYKKALGFSPHNHPLTIYYSKALLQSGQSKQAREILYEHAKRHQSSPLIYKLLARAESETGLTIKAHQSLATFFYLSGETRESIRHLDIALKLTSTSDIYQRLRIENRLKELKKEVKLEKEHKEH